MPVDSDVMYFITLDIEVVVALIVLIIIFVPMLLAMVVSLPLSNNDCKIQVDTTAIYTIIYHNIIILFVVQFFIKKMKFKVFIQYIYRIELVIMPTTYKLSTVTKVDKEFVVPTWILDDVEYFYPEVCDEIVREDDNIAVFNIKYFSTFVQLRKQVYWLCNWYKELVVKKYLLLKLNRILLLIMMT